METYIYYHRFDKTMNSHDLIHMGLRQYFQAIGRKDRLDTLTVCPGEPHKKPYFKEYPEIYHNVSHSGDWWVCAYGLTENGLDLQQEQEKKVDKIAKRFFHPREVAWLQGKEKNQFFRLWAYNESYVKYVGDGLTQGLEYFSVVPEEMLESKSVSGEVTSKEAVEENRERFVLGVEGVCQQEIPFVEEGYWLVLTTKEEEKVIVNDLKMCEYKESMETI